MAFPVQNEKGWGSGGVGIIIRPFCRYKVIYTENCPEYQMIAVKMRNTHAAVSYVTLTAAPKHRENTQKNVINVLG